MSDHLEIQTFGRLCVRIANETVLFDQRKAAALLVYLACTQRAYPREFLAEMLWEERTQSQALSNLRVTLTDLRKHAGAYLQINRETVGMDPDGAWKVDAITFETCLASSMADVQSLETTLALYQGDFLAGFYVDSAAYELWTMRERERLRLLAMDGLDHLIACCLAQKNYAAGLLRAYQLREMDPLREETYCWLMKLYAASAQRGKAMEQYEILCSELKREYGADPSPEIADLYRRIQSGSFAPDRTAPTIDTSSDMSTQTSGTRSAILIHSIQDIPARVNPLIGRQALLDEISALLDQNQRVLLQGFSGMGKTVLAAEIAAHYMTRDEGPVLWLTVGKEKTLTLLEALARPFGAQQAVARAQEECRFQVVRNLIAENAIQLVILDNVWDGRVLKQILDTIPAGTRLLVTSRERFPVGRIVTVGGLALPDALTLLSYHACTPYSLDSEGACMLCQSLGYHPFAIEIAGKTLQVDELTPAGLLARIGRSGHLMKMPGWFADEGRESVKDLLDASLEAIDPGTREVFLAFGALFVPNATSELIALCINRERADIEQALTILHQRGLAECNQPANSFSVHDLAFSYGRANALMPPLPVLRACQEYVRLHLNDIAALDTEIDNLLGAARMAYQVGVPDILVEILRLLAVSANYFDARGYSQPAFELLDLAIAGAKSSGHLETAHYLLSKLGNGYSMYLGLFPPAVDAYTEALELAQLLNDHTRQAKMLTLIGTTRFRQGELDADEYYESAYDMAVAFDDMDALAFILSHRAYYAAQKVPPDYESCRRFADESVQLAERLGNDEIRYRSLLNRASAERDLGLFEQASESDQEAYQMALAQKNRVWEAGALCGIGEDYHAMGNRNQAQFYLEQALILYRQNKEINELNRLMGFMREHGYDEETFYEI